MKKLIAILLTAAMLLTLTGCAGNTQTTATQATEESKAFTPKLDTQAEISLNVVGDYGNFEALEQVIQDFQQYYPNVTITYEQLTDFNTGFPIRCASGESLDLFFVNTMNYARVLAGAIPEYTLDLNTIDGIDLSAINEKALEGGQLDGAQVLLPVFYQTYGLIANKTLLEKYGLSVPTTYEELINACDTLLSQGITPIYGGLTLRTRLFESAALQQLMTAENRDALCADMQQGVLDPSIAQAAVDAYQLFDEKGYFNPEADTLKDTYGSAILRFFEGDVPFLVSTSDTISGCKKREAKSEAFTAAPFDYTYFIPSVTAENEPAVLRANMFFGVYNKSEHLDYASEFIRFMATEPELKALPTVKGMPSVLKAATGDSRFVQVESLAEDRRLYSVDVPCGISALSSLNASMELLPDGSAQAMVDYFAEKMAN